MKQLLIEIEYTTQWGEYLVISGGIEQLGNWDVNMAKRLNYIADSKWHIVLTIPQDREYIDFRFFVKRENEIIREEYGEPHSFYLNEGDSHIECQWQNIPKQKYFHSSIFYNSIFKQEYSKQLAHRNSIQLVVECIHVEQSQELVLCGDSSYAGNWNIKKALPLIPFSYGKWYINISNDKIADLNEYKFGIRDKKTKALVEWEEGFNRTLKKNTSLQQTFVEFKYNKEWLCWKASGVVIPIFSLRSESSFGIGEFSDLRLLIDWATQTRMRIIQVLPINDTTSSYTWHDSYPYKAISIYALNPIYLGLSEFRLKDKNKLASYTQQAKELNELSTLDYGQVLKLKNEYLNDLYDEIAEEVLRSESFNSFLNNNYHWLFPYACFCYFRDRFKVTEISRWGEYQIYDEVKLKELIKSDKKIEKAISQVFFTQFLLHKQLSEAKEYAHSKGITLKGDIPIGIDPNSVEAWTEPHLFNLDSKTGAPPDAFSVNGQNWGFPTYNWKEMSKDGYSWWIKRFRKMADYFDAYRIDHILGFFRIWEIPKSFIHGLSGYFSPALPLSIDEINNWGYNINIEHDTTPSIHKDDLETIFYEFTDKVINDFLSPFDNEYYILRDEVNTQEKIKKLFLDQTGGEITKIKEGLYKICDEVLFIRDKYEPEKFHPRISLQYTSKFKRIEAEQKEKLNRLYDHFFYQRHNQFWRDEAMSKLPTLINSTDMLVCGEDLGMVPNSVPSVMHELEILSLEIQRMPKENSAKYNQLNKLPYLSVATTSTHDMSPLRMWWKEDKEGTQNYYNNILNREGIAPEECTSDICMQIIKNHLASPAMLTIIPLQDWLSISDTLKRKNADEERINEPANPDNNWNYRMHISLEELLEEKDFSNLLEKINKESGR